MTIEAPRPPVSAATIGPDADLVAGLWEEAPFARLPWDAPAELRELVDEVENPRRVYAVHRASRRHNFQLIVQKCVFLCPAPHCSCVLSPLYGLLMWESLL